MYDAPMQTFRDLINAIGIPTIAKVTGVGYNTIQGWRYRDSVPPTHWAGLLDAGREAGIAATIDELVLFAAVKRKAASDDTTRAA